MFYAVGGGRFSTLRREKSRHGESSCREVKELGRTIESALIAPGDSSTPFGEQFNPEPEKPDPHGGH